MKGTCGDFAGEGSHAVEDTCSCHVNGTPLATEGDRGVRRRRLSTARKEVAGDAPCEGWRVPLEMGQDPPVTLEHLASMTTPARFGF